MKFKLLCSLGLVSLGLFSSFLSAGTSLSENPSNVYPSQQQLQNYIKKKLAAPNSQSNASLTKKSNQFSKNDLTGMSTERMTDFHTEDLRTLQNLSTDITPETTNLLGETINLSMGQVSFEHTDISLKGNSGIPMHITREHSGSRYSTESLAFGDWHLNIPKITTTYYSTPNQWNNVDACSGYQQQFGSNRGFWPGVDLKIPGKVNDKVLYNVTDNFDTGGYRYVTKSNWRIRCETHTGGESFVAVSPDGLSYTFSEYDSIQGHQFEKGGDYENIFVTPSYVSFKVSKIEDRFGNKVNFNYDSSSRLTSITEAHNGNLDNRQITLTYFPNSRRIQSVTSNGKTWNYQYKTYQLGGVTRYSLEKVTRPDGKFWLLDFLQHTKAESPAELEPYAFGNYTDRTCRSSVLAGNQVSVTHPEGVKGTFTLMATLHGRTKVPQFRDSGGLINRKCNYYYSIKTKTLSGAGFGNQTWSYDYSENWGHWPEGFTVMDDANITRNSDGGWAINWSGYTSYTDHANNARFSYEGTLPANIDDFDYKYTKVTSPDGSVSTHYFDRRFDRPMENKEVAVDRFSIGGTKLLQRIEKYFDEYPHPSGGRTFGETVGGSGIPFGGAFSANIRMRLEKVITRLYDASNNETTYTTEYSDFNTYAVPQKIKEYNSIPQSDTRYTLNSFNQDKTNWVLNLPASTQISGDGNTYTTVSESTYHSSTGSYKSLPFERKSYGRWLKKYSQYHADGNLKKVEYNTVMNNGSNRYQLFENYKRGQAQKITVPNRYDASATEILNRTVDDNGWVTNITDFSGLSTDYYYDVLGRLISIDAPTGILDTHFEWSTNATGQPVRTSQRCTLNAGDKTLCQSAGVYREITTMDALFRPLSTQKTDVANNINRYQRSEFNVYGKPIFTSQASDSATITSGLSYHYDGLQRLIKTEQIINGTSVANQTTEFLKDNTIKVNNYRGKETTTSYLAYGAPASSTTLSISSPESVVTSFAYNILGDLLSVTQSGPGKNGVGTLSQTESYIYNTYHQLCKTTRNDVGDSAVSVNVFGEVLWQAQGVGGSRTTCDLESVGASEKVSFTYDNLGDTHTINYPDSTPDLTYEYDAQGNLLSLASGGVTQSYAYNPLHQLEVETFALDNKLLSVDYAYDASGFLSAITYPDSVTIKYAPNAFGEPTKAGIYAREVVYHANGMLKSFNYGNGLEHKTTLNTRQLPSQISDIQGSQVGVNQSYEYDYQGNISSLTDNHNSAYSLTSLLYDDLDRLTSVTGGSAIGNSTIEYDGLGNITTYNSKNSTIDYTYNTNNQLVSTSGTKAYNFSYDGRGNVSHNGFRSFDFNRGNQLASSGSNSYVYDGFNRRVKTQDSKGTSYSFYNKAGTLLYREVNGEPVNYVYLGKKLVAKTGESSSSVSSRQHYKPFGETIESPKDDVGYTGHKFDTDLGLSYMQARYYDPAIGRFYSNDPIGIRDVHSFNRYTYANNNPYKYVDPDGRAVETAWDAASLAISATMFIEDPSWTNAGWLALDALATAVPFVPGGAGIVRQSSKAADSMLASSRADNMHSGIKLNDQLTAEAIANGHAATKHLATGEFGSSISTVGQLKSHIEAIMNHPTKSASMSLGRTKYFDEATGTIVVVNPSSVDKGTAFVVSAENVKEFGSAEKYFDKAVN
ncbi:RHS repeat domain-containing protein [Aliikangiella sp. IMCC44359]|uniref:RHS repeat domain-containing protein n=1 Tax=Aliikangiella sp. IMCC44359 TaxID=3459125 RepID=UPI00403B1A2D